MRFRGLLIPICFSILPGLSFAQFYETGQDPSSLKWMQIKTERFKVIYPGNYGAGGINFAKSLDEAYSGLISLYPEKKFRIPVIIHNYTINSNGYVAWAPSRMEIYPTPEQNTIPLDPDRQLALHELTHVLQMESLNKGFTKGLSLIMGQQFPGIVSSLLPLWFLEGDAVFSESVLTQSGRGRSPSFMKRFKALSIEKGRMYKYDKIVNGSFKDFVPDHYESGFQMMAWSYAKYGTYLWRNALKKTASEPFTINPVNLSLSKSASLTKKKLYNETFDTLNTLWNKDLLVSGSESYEQLNPPKGKQYINYHSPLIIGADSIIAVKTTLYFPPSFVLIRPSEKSEKRIHVPGYLYPWFISAARRRLTWVETHFDPRWENRSWSVIKVLDLSTGFTRQLSRKSRFMSASISKDGNYIAATENTVDKINNLVIVDAWNGEILKRIPVPENAYLQKPQWDATGKIITVISLTERGEGIISYDLDEGRWDVLIEPGINDIQSSFLRNDSLFFISSSSGTDNIYLLTPDKSVAPLTNSRFGVSDLSINGYSLLFTDYSASGNNICHLTLPDRISETDANKTTSSFLINRYKDMVTKPSDKSGQIYNPVPYRKWQHLFRFHSWMPFYADIEQIKSDPASVRPGFTLMSQNNLSTLISTLGYEYSENRHKLHSTIRWQGWYFVFESRIDYGQKPEIEDFDTSVEDPAYVNPGFDLTNTISLPLIFRNGRFNQSLYISGSSMLQNDYIYVRERGVYDRTQNQLTGRFYLSNYSRSALRDIYPRWAQIIDISHSYYPGDKELYGNISTVRSAFYFPGLIRNQGIKLRAEFEGQQPVKFLFNNRTSMSRGFDEIISKKKQFYSADYFMPLAYPDLNISSLLYITRIRADLFYDLTTGTGRYVSKEFHDIRENFRSFGVELVSDFYLFRMPFMVSAGAQATLWKNLGEYPVFRLIFNIDLFGMNIGKNRM